MLRGIGISVTFCALAVAAAGQSRSSLPDAPSQTQRRQLASTPPVTRPTLTARASAPYQPLTGHDKFRYFVHHAYSPYTFLNGAYTATYAQATGDPWEYGGGMEGWSKRFGAAMAGAEARGFFGTFFFPVLLHQDPRYFAMYQGPLPKRAVHALSRAIIIRADDGHNTLNTSGLLTIAFTEALATAWVPEGQRSVGRTFSRMGGALQGDATTYLLREFTPDLHRLFRRIAPKKVKKIEEKLPQQITGMSRGD